MKLGAITNISGNYLVLREVDRLFDELGVDVRICLGGIAGLYPFVDECVEILMEREYLSLRTHVDDGFVRYCDRRFDFEGWSTWYLNDALKYAQTRTTRQSIDFLRQLPECRSIASFGLKGLCKEVRNSYLYNQAEAQAAFSVWTSPIVLHAAHLDPHVWHEDLSETFLETGKTVFHETGRLLISSGSLGCAYMGGRDRKQLAAILLDDVDRSVELVRPVCETGRIHRQLRSSDYPPASLEFLEAEEFESWRTTG